jgi:hypothetical protein
VPSRPIVACRPGDRLYDDDLAVARLAWLAHDDQAALDQACDVCLSYTDIDLGIRGRAIGLLARVLYPDLPPDPPSDRPEGFCCVGRGAVRAVRLRP